MHTVRVMPPPGMTKIMENGLFLVFVCTRPRGWTLLMVKRKDGKEGMSWDTLFWIKNELGYKDREAVEIHPAEGELVDEANMRHLWVLPVGERMPWGLDKRREQLAKSLMGGA